jgi:hypothetical protein
MGLERGPLGRGGVIDELFEGKIGSGLEKRK